MAENSSEKIYELLLRLYNEVDSYLRSQYEVDKYADHSFLIQEISSKNRIVARHQQQLRAIAQLRNVLVHNPFRTTNPIALPSQEVVSQYQKIRDSLINPVSALSIAIPGQKIYSVSPETKLSEVLKEMDKNIYTHVPIIENDKMIGIFSENTLLSYLADSGETIITDDMKIKDFTSYLPLKSHHGENFVFLSRKSGLGKVYEAFNDAIHKHQRIGMLFITEHGNEFEKPLGIITAWDLASPDFELY